MNALEMRADISAVQQIILKAWVPDTKSETQP